MSRTAHIVFAPSSSDIVLAKMLAGLADIFTFHYYHLTCIIPGGDYQVNRWLVIDETKI